MMDPLNIGAVFALAPNAGGWLYAMSLRRQLRISRYLGAHDPLTGLLNRPGFYEQAARITQQPSVVAFIDVDHFKQINDTFGHRAGDAALAILGGRLRRQADALGGVAGRLGGDEFVLALPLPPNQTWPVQWANDILNTLKDRLVASLAGDKDWSWRYTTVDVTIGATVTASDPSRPTLGPALNAADEAMYQVKHNGKGKIGVVDNFFPTTIPPATGRPLLRTRDLDLLAGESVGASR